MFRKVGVLITVLFLASCGQQNSGQTDSKQTQQISSSKPKMITIGDWIRNDNELAKEVCTQIVQTRKNASVSEGISLRRSILKDYNFPLSVIGSIEESALLLDQRDLCVSVINMKLTKYKT